MTYYDDYERTNEYEEIIETDLVCLSDYNDKEIARELINVGLIEGSGIAFSGTMNQMIFAIGNEQEVYSAEELRFIRSVEKVLIFDEFYKSMKDSRMLCNTIVVKTFLPCDDSIVFCLAFQKITNKALDGYNQFVFIANDGIFIGCRLFNNDDVVNCALSSPIKTNIALEEITNELIYLPDAEEFIDYYSQYIAAVALHYPDNQGLEERIIKKRGAKASYFETIDSLEKELGINASNEKTRYLDFFEEDIEAKYLTVIEELEDSLSFIKSNRVNTYELLFEAEKFMQRAEDAERTNTQEVEEIDDTVNEEDEIDEEALALIDSPDEMIKLLKKRRGL